MPASSFGRIGTIGNLPARLAPDRSPAVGDQKQTLLRDGRDKPRWNADRKTVFHIRRDRMMTKAPLFSVNPVGWTPSDVTPDGRFLVTSVVDQEGQPSVAFTVVLNWQQLFSR